MDEKPELAIVSPCHGCKNQRSEIDDSGKPFCPRRYWEKQKQAASDAGQDTSVFDLLTASGNDSNDGTLKNPVYWKDGQSVLIWTASLLDNAPAFVSDQLVKPDLLSGSFDTDNIVCKLYPYLSPSRADLYHLGALQENDQIVLHNAPLQQVDQQTGARMNIGGTVERINVLHKFSFSDLLDHESPEGS